MLCNSNICHGSTNLMTTMLNISSCSLLPLHKVSIKSGLSHDIDFELKPSEGAFGKYVNLFSETLFVMFLKDF